MHKGRTYPYLPEYFCVPGFFWPGFVPWKIKLVATSASKPPPWSAIPLNYVGISGSGEPDSTANEVQWILDNTGLPFGYDFDFTAGPDLITGSGGIAMILNLNYLGNRISQAWDILPFPQYRFGINGFANITPPPPPPFTTGLNMVVSVANYAEGGSPWHGPG